MCCKDDGDANIEIVPSALREIDRNYRIKQNGSTCACTANGIITAEIKAKRQSQCCITELSFAKKNPKKIRRH